MTPLAHVSTLDELDDKTGAEMFVTARNVARALRKATSCEGVNLVLSDGAVAGQDVFHVHLHVKPRWTDDDVMLSWSTETPPEQRRKTLADALRSCLT